MAAGRKPIPLMRPRLPDAERLLPYLREIDANRWYTNFGPLEQRLTARLAAHFGVDPLFFGILVALNLQTSFLTPPMAMAAYYLKGVAPPGVELMQIFKGVMPFLSMIILSMVMLYTFPQIAFWLPDLVYNR